MDSELFCLTIDIYTTNRLHLNEAKMTLLLHVKCTCTLHVFISPIRLNNLISSLITINRKSVTSRLQVGFESVVTVT